MPTPTPAAISFAALVVPFICVECGGDGAERGDAPPQRILLISMDTVRGDALGNLASDRLPALKEIASGGARFTRFYAASTYTIPSHLSMFTGLDPEELGATGEQPLIREDVRTLASRLSAAGYRTHAFHEGGYVGARYGFARGFDRYVQLPRVALVGDGLARVLGWMERHADERYFLFLHTYAAHNPYGGYDDYRAAHPERGLRGAEEVRALDEVLRRDGSRRTPDVIRDLTVYNQLCDERTERAFSAPILLPPDFDRTTHFAGDLDAIRASYLERVRLIDRAVGRIRAQLEREDQWDDTLLIVTSDHGEAFFEHGLSWHGYVPFDEVLSVPLLVSYPRLFEDRAPVVVEALAWHLDLYPTILSLAGLEADPDRRGVDLSPLLDGRGAPSPARAVFPLVLEVPLRAAMPPRRAVIRSGHKYIEGHDHFGFADGALFDLGRDPSEKRALDDAEQVGALRRELEDYRAALRDFRAHVAPEAELDEAELEELRALGYAE